MKHTASPHHQPNPDISIAHQLIHHHFRGALVLRDRPADLDVVAAGEAAQDIERGAVVPGESLPNTGVRVESELAVEQECGGDAPPLLPGRPPPPKDPAQQDELIEINTAFWERCAAFGFLEAPGL